ncbi:transketolase [Actinacidiphila bryophytorum]|uniref:Apulose-4-phosphate transketolase subunit A n=1 Tax=Actinacidiphila bryophytorum TaxID=1436133 RepID=A0A9W4GYK2_9ACTN|nr:transketolase [Actinacidiphila bryophytorum]MBM9438387.1 transketolase [Actinacidiphila bryophytorum]MBN6543486.1 transketolase [Actinacidiphila bryophytorum]CAG7614254.1 Apulose-4-phosphate transketolase subunit A [Actinacidiphila bryophytorum]
MLTADTPTAARYRDARRALQGSEQDDVVRWLQSVSAEIRIKIIRMIDTAQLGHVGGDLSVTDILVTLFGAVLEVDPEDPRAPDRDRFILSKGHCAAALYSTLAWCGYFPEAELGSFMAPLSPLNGHPNRRKVPGVETNTGPLGHGFPVAVGCALAARLRGSASRTVVVLGDGEMQEGSNWEAAMTAGHYGLSSLTAIVDRNRLQQGARTEETKALEPLDAKWAAFGWEVRVVDGHDHAALLMALLPSATGRPVAVVANTIKGRGVSFMEDRVEWHHKVPTADQVRAAIEELSR